MCARLVAARGTFSDKKRAATNGALSSVRVLLFAFFTEQFKLYALFLRKNWAACDSAFIHH